MLFTGYHCGSLLKCILEIFCQFGGRVECGSVLVRAVPSEQGDGISGITAITN